MQKFINVIVLLAILLFPVTADAELPFTVHTIYFQPTDALAPTDRITELMKEVQNLYRSEMNRYGYRLKTFRLGTDKRGHVGVHTVNGRHSIAHYDEIHADEIINELPNKFRDPNNIHVIILGGLRQINDDSGTPRCSKSRRYINGACGGDAMIAAECGSFGVRSIAHELGFVFGLSNNIMGAPSVMGGGTARIGITESLTFYQARWLDKHLYFNDVEEVKIIGLQGFKDVRPIIDVPQIYKVHPFYVIEKYLIRIRFDCASNNGLHQAQISGVGWDELNARAHRDTAEIVVDRSYLSNFQNRRFLVMDVKGNIGELEVDVADLLANAIENKLTTWALLKTLR